MNFLPGAPSSPYPITARQEPKSNNNPFGENLKNKAGYTAIQSRTVGQEQYSKNRSEFRNVTDGRTDRRTDRPTRQGVESCVRV